MIRVLSLFSGIGAFERALDNLNIEYELVNYCEIDKYASKAYSILHGVSEDMNLHDVTMITEEQCKAMGDVDLLTYGFPCQSLSQAGHQHGLEHNGKRTRSGLVWNAHDIIGWVKPRIALCENVKALTSKKFTKEFKAILDNLEDLGYNSYWSVLNSKDYGVAQHRERVFIVSVRKDIDDGLFSFPQPFPLMTRLKDVLQDNVPEKYYLKKQIDLKTIDRPEPYRVINVGNVNPSGHGINGSVVDANGLARTVTYEKGEGQKVACSLRSRSYRGTAQALELSNREYANAITSVQKDSLVAEPIRLGNIYGDFGTGYASNVWDKGGISPALMTMQGGGRQPMITEPTTPAKIERVGNYYPINPMPDGTCRTVKANYNKVSFANFAKDSGTFGATGVCTTATKEANNLLQVHEDKVVVRCNTSKGYEVAFDGDCLDLDYPSSTTRRGRVQHGLTGTITTDGGGYAVTSPAKNEVILANRMNSSQDGRIIDTRGISPTHTAGHYNQPKIMTENLRIRKLTPAECFKLMGFDYADAELLSANGISNTQLYKQAGNSIVVDVLVEIFRNLFRGEYDEENR